MPAQTATISTAPETKGFGCNWSTPVNTKELQKQGDIVAVCNELHAGKRYSISYEILAAAGSRIERGRDQIAFRVIAPGIDEEVVDRFDPVERKALGIASAIRARAEVPSDGIVPITIRSLRCMNASLEPFDCQLDVSVKISANR